jgi:SpoVK/Ycf46/Vps4 family AAA+-type ATPase
MHEEVKAAVNTLLEEIENVTPFDRVLIVAATNLFEQAVDYAADRRFDMVINFKRPNFQQRLDLLTVFLSQFRIDSEVLIILTKKTSGYTQADIKKIVKLALNKCLTSNRKLTSNDLLYSFRYVQPTRTYNGGRNFD